MKIIAKIENSIVFRALLKVEVAVLIITSVLAAAFVFAGVFLRYVLKSNFFGQEEILTVVAMWLSSAFKSPKAKKIVELVILVVSFAVILVFCIWGCEYMKFNLTFKSVTTGLKIPMYLSQLPLLVGFIMMELYTVFHIFRVATDKHFGEPKETDAVPEGGDA